MRLSATNIDEWGKAHIGSARISKGLEACIVFSQKLAKDENVAITHNHYSRGM